MKTTTFLLCIVLFMIVTAFTLCCQAACGGGYSATLDYKSGMVVADLEGLSGSGESGSFVCKATKQMWFKVYLNGELYNSGRLWDFIDWSVNGAYCTIESPFHQKQVSVQYTNLQTTRDVTVTMDAKPYFYAVDIMTLSEQGKSSSSYRLVRYWYATTVGIIQGLVWIIGAIGFIITLFSVGNVILLVIAAV